MRDRDHGQRHPTPGDLLAPEPAVLTGARIGYARVSTSGQLLDRQQHALAKAGCIRIFADKLSGTSASRPELAACLDYLRPGDTLGWAAPGPIRGATRRRVSSSCSPRRVIRVVYADLLKCLNSSTATARVQHSPGSTVALSRRLRRAAVRTQRGMSERCYRGENYRGIL
jgi:hypothetical protein